MAICFMLNVCEEFEVWPVLCNHGIVHLIRKKPGECGAQGLRPITVLVVLHRVWSIGRAKDFLAWYSGIASATCRGGLRDTSTADSYFQVALEIECGHVFGEHKCGLVIDLVKCFNTIPRQPVFSLLRRITADADQVIDLWEHILSTFTRSFRVSRFDGEPFGSTSGFPEGCALSVFAMLLLTEVWHDCLPEDVSKSAYSSRAQWSS